MRSFEEASEAFEISSRTNISLSVYSEFTTKSSTCFTSALNLYSIKVSVFPKFLFVVASNGRYRIFPRSLKKFFISVNFELNISGET